MTARDGGEDVAGGGAMGALVAKLQHPLAAIRSRALKRLLFKLRERLVGAAQLEVAGKALAPRLLAALREPALELDALHALELLVASGSRELLGALRTGGAALELQRAAVGKAPELETAYEKLVQTLLVTPQSVAGHERRSQELTARAEPPSEAVAPAEGADPSSRRQLSESQTRRTRRWASELPALEASGWRPAPVSLAPTDEQLLFEFEVRLTLRTTTEEVVGICREAARRLLRDFPAEVFLRRPALLQYLLHLVRQPLLPPSAGALDVRMPPGRDQAVDFSLGVNYFDAIGSETYSSKRGNLAGAVLMAAVVAVEALLAALSETLKAALDPALVVSDSEVASGYSLEAHDHRRHFYPRTNAYRRRKRAPRSHEVSGDDQAGAAEGFSVGGAAYTVFMNLLPLVRNATHPRLHVLNVLHLAVGLLKERQADPSASSTEEPNALDKQRLETIFGVLSDVCRPITAPAAAAHASAEEELPPVVQWKLVGLVIRLLQLHPAVKGWIASPVSLQIPPNDWDQAAVVQCLSDLDGAIPAFVRLKHAARKDVAEMRAFIAAAKHHAGAEFARWSLSSSLSLHTAANVLDAAGIWKHEDAPAIANGVAFALWSALSKADGGAWADEDIGRMRRIVSRSIGMAVQPTVERSSASVEAATMIFDHLRGLLGAEESDSAVDSEARSRFLRLVVRQEAVLAELLWAVALLQEADGDQATSAALFSLWRVVDVFPADREELTAEQLQSFRPLIPVLQVLAYGEASSASAERAVAGQATRSRLAELLNRVEEHVSVCERVLLISRCLLHSSPYLRRSAASGLRRVLSRDLEATLSSAPAGSELDDPFTSLLDDTAEPDAAWETKLAESPLPTDGGDSRSDIGHDLSSQTRKLSKLCKIARTTADLVQESALKELVLLMETATPTLVALFDELGETTRLFQLCRDALARPTGPPSTATPTQAATRTALTPHALRLLRTLLLRSEALRTEARSSADFLRDVLPLLFDPRLDVRVHMYYIVLLLTCSAECFVETSGGHLETDNGRTHDLLKHRSARILSTTRSAFGLYASFWARCGVRVVGPELLMHSLAALSPSADVAWLQAVQAAARSNTPLEEAGSDMQASSGEDNTGDDGQTAVLEPSWQAYDRVVSRLQDAPSHGKFLNGVYHLAALCHASRSARARLARQWEAIFERYFAVKPKSPRDEVVVGAAVHAVGAALPAMARSGQLRVLLVAKRSLLPLLQRAKSAFFALELARLLIHLSESRVADLFPSLVADTDVVASICANYSAVYSTDPVLHATMLQLFERLVRSVRAGLVTPDAPFHMVIRQRLVEMASPIVTVLCRHRPPGSFLESDVFCAAARCLVGVLQTVSYEELQRGSSPLQHTDAGVLLDGSWCSRLIFHHASAVRALGFAALGEFASRDVQLRMLELAVSTAADQAESDLVRAQACAVVTKLLLLYPELPHEQQLEVAAVVNRDGPLAGLSAKLLVGALKSDRVLVQSAVAFTRLLRALLARQDALAEPFGSIGDTLRRADEGYSLFPELVAALSLRGWTSKCDWYASSEQRLRSCDPWIWRRSVLPSVLELTAQAAMLLQATIGAMGAAHARYLNEHTTLKYSLMDLIAHTEQSLSSLGDREGEQDASPEHRDVLLRELHYGSLLQAGRTLSLMLEESAPSKVETPVAAQVPTTGMETVETALVRADASLMSAAHPVDFRIAFAGVVASAALAVPRFTSLDDDATKALTSAVFDLFADTADVLPSPSCSSHPVASLRVVSSALQALLDAAQASRRVVEAKRGLEFCMAGMKALFVAIRTEGGFGSARKGSAATDGRVLELSDRASVHLDVLGSLVGADAANQRLARTQRLPDVLLTNWSVMKAAHLRGSPLLASAVRLLGNYTYRNDDAKASLAQPQPLAASASSTVDDRSIMALLCELALNSRTTPSFSSQQSVSDADRRDAPVRSAACDVLSAAVLSAEGRKWTVRVGVVGKLVAAVEQRLQLAAQTRKPPERIHAEHLGRLLRVLAALAAAEEGAVAVFASGSSGLALVLQDILQSREPATQTHGYLLVRNLALADAAKSHAAAWEDLLPYMLDACARHLDEPADRPPRALEFLGDALWALVFDNQRLRASLLSRPPLLRSLEQLVAASTEEARSSLERALRLVKG